MSARDPPDTVFAGLPASQRVGRPRQHGTVHASGAVRFSANIRPRHCLFTFGRHKSAIRRLGSRLDCREESAGRAG